MKAQTSQNGQNSMTQPKLNSISRGRVGLILTQKQKLIKKLIYYVVNVTLYIVFFFFGFFLKLKILLIFSHININIHSLTNTVFFGINQGAS